MPFYTFVRSGNASEMPSRVAGQVLGNSRSSYPEGAFVDFYVMTTLCAWKLLSVFQAWFFLQQISCIVVKW